MPCPCTAWLHRVSEVRWRASYRRTASRCARRLQSVQRFASGPGPVLAGSSDAAVLAGAGTLRGGLCVSLSISAVVAPYGLDPAQTTAQAHPGRVRVLLHGRAAVEHSVSGGFVVKRDRLRW